MHQRKVVEMCMSKTSFHETLHFMKKGVEMDPVLDKHNFASVFPGKNPFKNYEVRKPIFKGLFRMVVECFN